MDKTRYVYECVFSDENADSTRRPHEFRVRPHVHTRLQTEWLLQHPHLHTSNQVPSKRVPLLP